MRTRITAGEKMVDCPRCKEDLDEPDFDEKTVYCHKCKVYWRVRE